MLEHLNFAIVVTAPIFLIVCLGIILKRMGMITNEFARIGSELVFKVTLPCLLFVKLIDSDFEKLPIKLIIYGLIATTVVFLILDYLLAPRIDQADRGAFVQGSYRSNMGIIGLAYCLNAYGDEALQAASIYMAIVTILYNILAVLTLTHHQTDTSNSQSIQSTIINILKNPLIVAIILALSFSSLSISVPTMILDTLGYFSQMTLPLALLCAGASIRWREFKSSMVLYWTTAAKLIFVPGLIVMGGILIGLKEQELGILYLMSAAPTAAASYPMIRAYGGNHYLAAAIIATTSIGSIIAITAGLFLLKVLAYI